MIVKLAGCLLVLSGSGGLGWYFSYLWKVQLKNLMDLRRMVFMLKGEILYANAPLQEAFSHVGKKAGAGAQLKEFFIWVAEQMGERRGEPFSLIWSEAVAELGQGDWEALLISQEDRQALDEFGSNLGYLDSSMQERTILLYLERLDERIEYLREHKRERCRLYGSLGILAGMFLVLLLY